MITPYYRDEWSTLYLGDAREVLSKMEPDSVQCVVTSPPYWALRDYGIEGQIGLERTVSEYVASILGVFQEVKRVVRKDGTAWINLGDTYSPKGKSGGWSGNKNAHSQAGGYPRGRSDVGMKAKDMCGIPWRVAFALQDDGWYLRSDIIWNKTNCTPSSVKDRPGNAHDYVFLLSKARSYFYDWMAVREPASGNAHSRGAGVNPKAKCPAGPNSRMYKARDVRNDPTPRSRQNESFSAAVRGLVQMRMRRSVWSIPTGKYRGAHFATFPPKLVEPCVLAGTSAKGCCPVCGAPQKRIVEPGKEYAKRFGTNTGADAERYVLGYQKRSEACCADYVTVGWKPGCKCGIDETVPCVVLDPFSGSGTIGAVALSLGRKYIGIDVKAEYLDMTIQRLKKAQAQPRLLEVVD